VRLPAGAFERHHRQPRDGRREIGAEVAPHNV
jgi:hypothetical protein